jgi:hypothetical protein
MKYVIVRFLEPNSLSGSIASWRLLEPYGHSVIAFDGRVYNAIPPKIVKQDFNDPKVAIPPRLGIDLKIHVTDEQFEAMESWCKSQVGKWYDLLSVIGWFLYLPNIHKKGNFYCFEFCRQAFVEVGIIPPSDDLISSERLMLDLHRAFCNCNITE